jgi:Lipoprotein LpqB beta-propeller domain
MSRRAGTGLLALALLVLAGCTGIPASSAPRVVGTVSPSATAGPTGAVISPQPGVSPSDMVNGYLTASVDAEAGHSTARQFLTASAARRWQDNPTVILSGKPTAGDAKISTDDQSAVVQVPGRRVGQLDASGVFSPILKGTGTGDEESFEFHLVRVSGQWRIDDPPPGVLIGSVDFSGFNSPYRQYSLYFFDPQQVLVPDLRYTSLTRQALASWLLTQLLAGPRPELAQTLVSAVPAQAVKSSVQIGNPTIVEMPGSGQLLTRDRNNLAVQLAFTLDQVPFSLGQLELTDSGKPVRIPASQSVQFSKASLNNSSVSPPPGGSLYFVRDGAVLDEGEKPAPGQLGQPGHNLASVALRRQASAQSLQVAALTSTGQLQIGTEQGLLPRRLPRPASSRPEWQDDNVWIGAGSHLYRVAPDGTVSPISLTSQVGPLPNGTITAVRLSPDGDRVALVIRGPNGIGSAWVGSVISTAADVRVDSLEQLTPPALAVTDLAWSNAASLMLVAAEPGAEARVWPFYSDGAQREDKLSSVGLRGTLTSIAAQAQEIVVSAGDLLWQYSNNGWVNYLGHDAPVPGINPVYAS